jgi:hypothetical protein
MTAQSSLSVAPDTHTLSGGPERVVNWNTRLAALFVMLALAGCAQGVTGQAQAPYAPYSPENNGNMHDSGGGGG